MDTLIVEEVGRWEDGLIGRNWGGTRIEVDPHDIGK